MQQFPLSLDANFSTGPDRMRQWLNIGYSVAAFLQDMLQDHNLEIQSAHGLATLYEVLN
jgi:hypothetical protein